MAIPEGPKRPPDASPPVTDTDSAFSRTPRPIGVPHFRWDRETEEWVPFDVLVGMVRGDAVSPEAIRATGGEVGFGPPIEQRARPLYFQGDENRLFSTLPTERIADLQLQMIRAGLLDPEDDEFFPGEWFGATPDAMNKVLGFANATGTDWTSALSQLVLNRQEAGGGDDSSRQFAGFAPPAYRPPDYDTLSQAVRQTMKRELGRDPEDWEMTVLAQQLEQDYRAKYDQDVAAAEQEHESRVAAAETGADQPAPDPVRDVDPVASFMERFREKYQPEIQAEQSEEDVMESRGILLRSILGIDEQIG